jgi:hypothetical protein
MWESLAIRQLGVLENVGSNPTILTSVGSGNKQSALPNAPATADWFTVVWRNR